MRRCDVVLVTHAHYDHLLDVPEVARNTGARVYGSANTCRLLRALGVPEGQIRQVGVGDTLSLGAFQVQVLPAVHRRYPWGSAREAIVGPASALACPRLSHGLGPQLPDRRAGCAPADRSRWAAACRAAGRSLVAGPASRPGHYGPILRAVRPKTVIPSHWDDFWRSRSRSRSAPCSVHPAGPGRRWGAWNLAAFRKGVEQIVPGTIVFVPEVLRVYDVMAEALRSRTHWSAASLALRSFRRRLAPPASGGRLRSSRRHSSAEMSYSAALRRSIALYVGDTRCRRESGIMNRKRDGR